MRAWVWFKWFKQMQDAEASASKAQRRYKAVKIKREGGGYAIYVRDF